VHPWLQVDLLPEVEVAVPMPPPPSLSDSASEINDIESDGDDEAYFDPVEILPPADVVHAAEHVGDELPMAGGNFSELEDGDEPGGPGDLEAGAEEPEAKKKAAIGTGQWYFDNQDMEVWEGSTVRILDVCLWMGGIKSDFRLSDAAVDAICLMIHWLLLPKNNKFPPSYHLIRAALGVPATVSCVRHVCDGCWNLFPVIHPTQHVDYKDQKCSTAGCQKPRFLAETGGKPVPRRCAYYLGEEETFLDLVSKRGMLDAILEHRKESLDQPWSFWGSEAGQALNKACGHKFTDPAADEIAIVVSLGVP